MTTRTTTQTDVAATLVFMQGAVAVLSTVEAAVVAAVGLAPPTNLMLTAATAALYLFLARKLRTRSSKARRATLVVEGLMVTWALIDLALALFIAHTGLGLVATITRLVLPIAVFRVLRRPAPKQEFFGTVTS